MKRITQTLEDIVSKLTKIESQWYDEFAEKIVSELAHFKGMYPDLTVVDNKAIRKLLERDFKVYLTIFRLFLELSKDRFEGLLREKIPFGIGIKSFKSNPDDFVSCLNSLGLLKSIKAHFSKRWSWDDILIERLKLGRGSAIKGQTRGRLLENRIEEIIIEIFGVEYDRDCNFVGLHNQIAKAEFAIPSKENPSIIFEAKAYGATGSKQTDVIGDIGKIIKVKKPFMDFLFVTDGITWKQRLNDFRKIINFQNDGSIMKIYTISMLAELKEDLISLKNKHNIQ